MVNKEILFDVIATAGIILVLWGGFGLFTRFFGTPPEDPNTTRIPLITFLVGIGITVFAIVFNKIDILTVVLPCCVCYGLFTLVDGIGEVHIYMTSARHSEGVDLNHYFLPGLVRIVIGGLIIAIYTILCIQGSSL